MSTGTNEKKEFFNLFTNNSHFCGNIILCTTVLLPIVALLNRYACISIRKIASKYVQFQQTNTK